MPQTPVLNPEQEAAVQLTQGTVLIIAGPGTGKTHTFAHKVAHLIVEKGVAPAQILAVTFTRSAAKEMKERLCKLLPAAISLEDLWLDTFHAIARRVLLEQGYPFGRDVPFDLIDDERKTGLLKGLLERRDIPSFLYNVRRKKQNLLPPESALEQEFYNRLLSQKTIDFDDLLVLTHQLFTEKPDIKNAYKMRFRYLLVDEFQDTSFAQYTLIKHLAGENLCAIGDPDQAIYGNLNGSFKPFDQFRVDFPNTQTVSLVRNYRSRSAIVEAAKEVISKNESRVPRELIAKWEEGLPVEILPFQNDKQEAEMIARRIEGLLGGTSYFTIDSRWAEKDQETYAYGLNDIAILFRFHTQAKKFETALGRAGIPFRTYGKKKENKNSHSDDYEEFLMDEDGAPSILLPKGEGITLMTLHRSKGLEFSVVFMVGCEQGVLPFDETKELAEERRLFYVGMTRAKNRLFLSYAKERFLFGQALNQGPSVFLDDIRDELRKIEENRNLPQKPRKEKQLSLFEI